MVVCTLCWWKTQILPLWQSSTMNEQDYRCLLVYLSCRDLPFGWPFLHRGLQKDYRTDRVLGTDVQCWFVHNSGKGFIDGHYKDYLVPHLYSFLKKPWMLQHGTSLLQKILICSFMPKQLFWRVAVSLSSQINWMWLHHHLLYKWSVFQSNVTPFSVKKWNL